MGYCRIVYDGMGKKETKEIDASESGNTTNIFLTYPPFLSYYRATLYIIYTCLHNNQTHPPSDVKYLITPLTHTPLKI
jgi:hypothetical protein